MHLNFIQKKKKRKQVHLKNFLKTAEEWLASPFYQARCAVCAEALERLARCSERERNRWSYGDQSFFSPTGHPKPEHSGSGKPDRFHRKPVETGQIPVQIQIVRRIWEPTGLTGIPAGLASIPVGLTGNRSNSFFFLFWFKFKCPQSILNKCLYNIF